MVTAVNASRKKEKQSQELCVREKEREQADKQNRQTSRESKKTFMDTAGATKNVRSKRIEGES